MFTLSFMVMFIYCYGMYSRFMIEKCVYNSNFTMVYDNYNYKSMGSINQLITGGWHNVGWEIGRFQRQKL